MTPQRRDSLLAGQSGIAQKVYAAITDNRQGASSVLDIAQTITKNTGAGVDIHVMRGCIDTLKKAGLVREVVQGSFRQVAVKEKEMVAPSPKPEAAEVIKMPGKPAEPMDALGSLSARLRAKANDIIKLADELDAQAIAIEERRDADRAETAKVRQLMALMKELG